MPTVFTMMSSVARVANAVETTMVVFRVACAIVTGTMVTEIYG